MGSGASARLSRVGRDLRAIGAVTQAVLDGEDLEELLGRIAREARILAAGISGVVVTVAPESGLMTFRGVDGIIVGPLRVGHVMPVAGTLTELALARGGNLVVDDPQDIPPAGRACGRLDPVQPSRHRTRLDLRRAGGERDPAVRAPDGRARCRGAVRAETRCERPPPRRDRSAGRPADGHRLARLRSGPRGAAWDQPGVRRA